ncbi:DUF1501 domain-containing protein [soil metagenome]
MDSQSCCLEFERAGVVSRRRFLGGMAATSGAAVGATMFGDAVRQASFGDTLAGNVLVVISLRGGVDGLGVVVPHGEPAYYAARPNINIPASQLIAKDAKFGLHPQMQPLEWLWNAGEMAAVQAVGMPVPNRSHFLAMEEIEDADPTSSVRRGWVNRLIGLDAGSKPSEAVNLGGSITPTALVGPAPVLATGDLKNLALSGTSNGYGARRRAHLQTVWGPDTGPLAAAAGSALQTVQDLAPVIAHTYQPSVNYPRAYPATGLSDALKDTAQLIKARVGTEVVTIDYGNWDMHSDYGNLDGGEMQSMLRGFASTVSAFMKDLKELRSKVTVVTISEFGRRVEQNGNRGLDHGWGNMMLLLGGGVASGYHGVWPGLGVGKLIDGDLAVTTDYRHVLGEVVSKRFPSRSLAGVFPGLAFNPVGVMS